MRCGMGQDFNIDNVFMNGPKCLNGGRSAKL